MPYVLKKIDDEVSEVNIYAGTIKIGSKEDCDLIVKSQHVLPIHAELYHQMPDYRLVASHSAFIQINDKDVLKWPIVLQDDDILTIGDIKYRFSIIQTVIPRSKRAAFSAYLAAALLTMLLLFELLVMLWLPYKLKESKAWELVTARQYTTRQVDKLRESTIHLAVPAGNQNLERLKKLLQSAEDDIAAYLRKYGEVMDLNQAISVRNSLNNLNSIVQQWPELCKKFKQGTVLNIKIYMDLLVKKLAKTMVNNIKERHDKSAVYE